ncbi:MAG: hypothetical protein PHW47_09905 [Lachnospira sp.]|nr:hypothetical protein [Lachnospira sp.]
MGTTLSGVIVTIYGNDLLYYGNLVSNIANESGSVEFTLPADFNKETMKLQLFTETLNGDYKTDYASDFVEVAYEDSGLTVTGGEIGVDYTYSEGVVNVLTDTQLTITNTDPAAYTMHRITIAEDISANITLAGVNIDQTAGNRAPIYISDNSKGNVTVTLKDGTVNTLRGYSNYAGIQKASSHGDGTLLIKGESLGTGVLNAYGGSGAAGIGSREGASDTYTSVVKDRLCIYTGK